MTTVQDELMSAFFEALAKVDGVNETVLASLKELLEKSDKPKVDELIATFALEKTDGSL